MVLLSTSSELSQYRTPLLTDDEDDDRSWQKYPNDQDTDSMGDWVLEMAPAEYENVPEFPRLSVFPILVAGTAILFVLVRAKAMTRRWKPS